MVKTLNIPLDNFQYKKLKEIKGERSWENFIMTLVTEGKEMED